MEEEEEVFWGGGREEEEENNNKNKQAVCFGKEIFVLIFAFFERKSR